MIAEAQPDRLPPSWLLSSLNGALRLVLRALCRLHLEQIQKIPQQGPMILAVNHVNFLDAPISFSHLYPRPLTALVKRETWDSPLLGPLFTLWNAIPIRRGEADLAAFQAAQQALAADMLLAVAPEGTRSGDGCLNKGYPGLALLALRSGAPILPTAFHGLHDFWPNLRRLKRTDCTLEVGVPFLVKTNGQALSRDVRQQIADEIMYQIAALLPPRFRGVYANLEQASEDYLHFPGGVSNLAHPRYQ